VVAEVNMPAMLLKVLNLALAASAYFTSLIQTDALLTSRQGLFSSLHRNADADVDVYIVCGTRCYTRAHVHHRGVLHSQNGH
jgi:hypothetical protein